MLQPRSGMSALSLARISEPSAPRAALLSFLSYRTDGAALCFGGAVPLRVRAYQRAGRETSEGRAVRRSGCCMGVALFWCLHQDTVQPLCISCSLQIFDFLYYKSPLFYFKESDTMYHNITLMLKCNHFIIIVYFL